VGRRLLQTCAQLNPNSWSSVAGEDAGFSFPWTVPVGGVEWLASLPDRITRREYTLYPSNWWQVELEDVSGYFGEEDIS